ncbi:MAG: UTP--glucose-1-phosphate uridylyltransferase [Acidobacteriaceae bacterium]|nr:UTP--glucose-1-phosphate uridylyltransferase [Acidobacteriaceae bacterium]
MPIVDELSAHERERYLSRALASLAAGEGVIGSLAAGQSSRMNPKLAPSDVQELVQRMYGTPRALESKAAVPIGIVDERVITFLGAFALHLARLEAAVKSFVNGSSRPNAIFILTNAGYATELANELSLNQHYGLNASSVDTPHQSLGFQFVANREDVGKSKLSPEDKAYALECAEQVLKNIQEGRPESVILPGEKAPLGHADFFHEMIRSGLLVSYWRAGRRWISLRNIDNVAAKFDADWLVTLGMFLERGLDFQAEVSPRIPGMKGGALIVDEKGNHRLTEGPSFDATWAAVKDELTQAGFQAASFERAAAILQEDAAGGVLHLSPYWMDFSPNTTVDLPTAQADLQAKNGKGEWDPVLWLFEKTAGERRWIRRVRPEDTYWFNNATAIISFSMWQHLYGKEGQTWEAFLSEVEAASPEEREAIVERGRSKFPVLIDPKPAKTQRGVAAKPEGNLWQATLIAGPEARIGAVGVQSIRSIDQAAYQSASPAEKRASLRGLRMLATKQWEGEAESYESNKVFIADLLDYIAHAPILE